jgi:hypothetical protein
MTGSDGSRDSNFVGGSGNITTGTFTDSQVVSVSGSQNTATVRVTDSSAAPDPWLERLEEELARIRVLLESEHGAVDVADREDALDAVTALQSDLPGIAASGSGASGTLRRRLRGLLGALDPVVKIIGTVATVQGILDHFK